MHRIALVLGVCLIATLATAESSQPRVLILGDSIAYDGRWTTRVESALRSTSVYADAVILNLALPSETASGLSEAGHAGGAFPRPCIHDRLSKVLSEAKPTLVIACYGMNDGIYQPFNDTNFSAYKSGIERLVGAVRANGARMILLTPPLHAPDKTKGSPQDYDNVLEAYAGWLNSRTAMGWEVIDIRPSLRSAIANEKSHNAAFHYATDQVHPGDFGHQAIADAVLAGLWPLLKLTGKPNVGSPERLRTIAAAQQILKLAWLSQVGHKRPGIPKGLPIDQAQKQASELLAKAKAL